MKDTRFPICKITHELPPGGFWEVSLHADHPDWAAGLPLVPRQLPSCPELLYMSWFIDKEEYFCNSMTTEFY